MLKFAYITLHTNFISRIYYPLDLQSPLLPTGIQMDNLEHSIVPIIGLKLTWDSFFQKDTKDVLNSNINISNVFEYSFSLFDNFIDYIFTKSIPFLPTNFPPTPLFS